MLISGHICSTRLQSFETSAASSLRHRSQTKPQDNPLEELLYPSTEIARTMRRTAVAASLDNTALITTITVSVIFARRQTSSSAMTDSFQRPSRATAPMSILGLATRGTFLGDCTAAVDACHS